MYTTIEGEEKWIKLKFKHAEANEKFLSVVGAFGENLIDLMACKSFDWIWQLSR